MPLYLRVLPSRLQELRLSLNQLQRRSLTLPQNQKKRKGKGKGFSFIFLFYSGHACLDVGCRSVHGSYRRDFNFCFTCNSCRCLALLCMHFLHYLQSCISFIRASGRRWHCTSNLRHRSHSLPSTPQVDDSQKWMTHKQAETCKKIHLKVANGATVQALLHEDIVYCSTVGRPLVSVGQLKSMLDLPIYA